MRAARKAGRTLIASPAGTRAAFAPQPLVPGSSVSVGLTAGDIALGAIGTVAYADGPDVWIFGHEMDGAGRRSLFLQDACIHTVVNNPVAAPDVATYKLGSPGNDLGTITSDGPQRRRRRPRRPAAELPAARHRARTSTPARCAAPSRTSPTRATSGSPPARRRWASRPPPPPPRPQPRSSTARRRARPASCASRSTLREMRAPLRVCNSYAIDGTSRTRSPGRPATDVAAAVAVLESYRFGTLHPTAFEIGMRVRRGLRQAFITGASGPRSRGAAARSRCAWRCARRARGRRSTRIVRMRVPLDAPAGLRTLRLIGTPADPGSDPSQDGGGDLSLVFEEEEAGGDDGGPQSLDEVREAFLALGRYDGVVARLGGEERKLLRDPRLRITGEARVQLRIR